MPFRNETQFSTDTLKIMGAAFDKVVERLHIPADDPRRAKLASLIVQLARAGVVDEDKLADQARSGLK